MEMSLRGADEIFSLVLLQTNHLQLTYRFLDAIGVALRQAALRAIIHGLTSILRDLLTTGPLFLVFPTRLRSWQQRACRPFWLPATRCPSMPRAPHQR